MKTWISILFLLQVIIQAGLKTGWIEYTTTTPMHEDLVTTLLGCTLLIIFSIERKDNK